MENEKGHIDFGEVRGFKIRAIHHNTDGTMDIESLDGVLYKNCVIKSYSKPKHGVTITEVIPFYIAEIEK